MLTTLPNISSGPQKGQSPSGREELIESLLFVNPRAGKHAVTPVTSRPPSIYAAPRRLQASPSYDYNRPRVPEASASHPPQPSLKHNSKSQTQINKHKNKLGTKLIAHPCEVWPENLCWQVLGWTVAFTFSRTFFFFFYISLGFTCLLFSARLHPFFIPYDYVIVV
jgi:hypothetical protein